MVRAEDASSRSIPGAIGSAEIFASEIAEGLDIRPTIAITRARLDLAEMRMRSGPDGCAPDGDLVHDNGSLSVIKVAIDPVWYLPGVAERFGVTETHLRRALFEQTGGMFPELVTRPDLHVFLPPIGGMTVYMFGDVRGSPIRERSSPAGCTTSAMAPTCSAPTSAPAGPISSTASRNARGTAQAGGLGVIVYNRKEGRALGEVTKFLVYNARKRQEGGDSAATYFERTECVAGVQDARFQQLMPDVIHWLGITRIDRFVSMSDMKHDALVVARASKSSSACRSPTSWSRRMPRSRSMPRRRRATTRRSRRRAATRRSAARSRNTRRKA